MAQGGKETDRRRDDGKTPGESRQHQFSAREIFRLILATYRASLPYLLIFVAGLLLATWLITELVF